jgi:hypothetical protein
MVDAEEAEARVRDAVEKTKNEAQRRSQVSAEAAAEEQARREAEHRRREAERARREIERARRRSAQREREAQELLARPAPTYREVDEVADEEALRAAWAGVKQAGNGYTAEVAEWSESRPSLKPVTKEERRTAREAARLLAALEKREARERKALAKAAAKRRLTGTYRS